MPSNPMQRKVRNSFFLGILVMLVITILIGTIAFMLVIKPKFDAAKKDAEQPKVFVCRLKQGQDVKSGEEITSSMLEKVEIPVASSTVATDFINEPNTISGYKSKINLKGGTVLTQNMLYSEEEGETADSLRYIEYNVVTIPTTLEEGDYVDIRLRLPNAQDLIVISKKEIISIYGQTLGLYLSEEEILLLNSAIVEAFAMPSSELYLAKYVEPGMQEKSIYTYSPTAVVVDLISKNPNIVSTARDAIVNRYLESGTVRNPINSELGKYTAEESKYNIEAGMSEQLEAARKAREDYLSGLEGY